MKLLNFPLLKVDGNSRNKEKLGNLAQAHQFDMVENKGTFGENNPQVVFIEKGHIMFTISFASCWCAKKLIAN